VVALTTYTLGQRGSNPRTGSCARQKARPPSFRGGSLACDVALSAVLGRLICKNRLRFIPLNTASVVRGVVSPAVAALGVFPPGVASTGEVGAPTRDALRRVCPKRWQRLHCKGPFGLRTTQPIPAGRRVR
jgi:hypothetical protein